MTDIVAIRDRQAPAGQTGQRVNSCGGGGGPVLREVAAGRRRQRPGAGERERTVYGALYQLMGVTADVKQLFTSQ